MVLRPRKEVSAAPALPADALINISICLLHTQSRQLSNCCLWAGSWDQWDPQRSISGSPSPRVACTWAPLVSEARHFGVSSLQCWFQGWGTWSEARPLTPQGEALDLWDPPCFGSPGRGWGLGETLSLPLLPTRCGSCLLLQRSCSASCPFFFSLNYSVCSCRCVCRWEEVGSGMLPSWTALCIRGSLSSSPGFVLPWSSFWLLGTPCYCFWRNSSLSQHARPCFLQMWAAVTRNKESSCETCEIRLGVYLKTRLGSLKLVEAHRGVPEGLWTPVPWSWCGMGSATQLSNGGAWGGWRTVRFPGLWDPGGFYNEYLYRSWKCTWALSVGFCMHFLSSAVTELACVLPVTHTGASLAAAHKMCAFLWTRYLSTNRSASVKFLAFYWVLFFIYFALIFQVFC